ncbi:hypothetical protein VNO78_05729 [Psophocarpus tetragonolobus]|uniref:Uncharacterized protein n=1 Tax=Psophocarpus tetragonolobus TaxID=3891 RepID=A0AAN9SRI4_PSOTE
MTEAEDEDEPGEVATGKGLLGAAMARKLGEELFVIDDDNTWCGSRRQCRATSIVLTWDLADDARQHQPSCI